MQELPNLEPENDFVEANDFPLNPQPDEFDKISTTNGLKIAHLNVNGLQKKIDDLKILVNCAKLDVLTISETKLNSEILNAEIDIPNFKLFRLDCDRHGGGVAIYCKDNLSSFDLSKLTNKEFESLWIKIKLKKSKPIHICTTYRSPSTTQ